MNSQHVPPAGAVQAATALDSPPSNGPANGPAATSPMASGLLLGSSPPSRPPGARRRKTKRLWWIFLALVVVSAAFVPWLWSAFSGPQKFTGLVHVVKRERLELAIVERGTLEAVHNKDYLCKVKAGSRGIGGGGGTASTIKWVIPDGTDVTGEMIKEERAKGKKGVLLMDLDDSALKDQADDQKIKVDKAKNDVSTAEANLEIALAQNHKDIESAKKDVELALLNLQQYMGAPARDDEAKNLTLQDLLALLEKAPAKEYHRIREQVVMPKLLDLLDRAQDGDYAQERSDLLANLEQQRDRASYSKRVAPLGYVSENAAESDQIKLRKMEGELGILQKYKRKQVLTDRFGKWEEAKRNLEIAKKQADSKEKQAGEDLRIKKDIRDQEAEKLDGFRKDISECQIYAEEKGLVIYFVHESSRYGIGSQQVIQQGEAVKEGQKLLRFPDLSSMKVKVKVHEALVSRVAVGKSALVRVDAYPTHSLKGRVTKVASVASQQEMFSSTDVTVYETEVEIDSFDKDTMKLKPGMKAEVTILSQESSEQVLTIPIQSVVGTIKDGEKRKCFIINEDGVAEERDIELGRSNEKMVEVRSGLSEGDKVALNPQPLLVGDRAKLKAATPRTKRTGEDTEEQPAPVGGDKKGKGGKGRKDGGGKGLTDAKGPMPKFDPAQLERFYRDKTPEEIERMKADWLNKMKKGQ